MNRFVCFFVMLLMIAGCDGIRLEPEHQLTSIEIEPKDTLIVEGEEMIFRLVARDETGEVVEIPDWRSPQWVVSDQEIVGLQGARMTGIAAGATEVRALLSGLSTSARVRVNPLWDVEASFAYITQAAQNPADPIPLIEDRKGLLRIFVTLDGFHEYEPPEIKVTLFRSQPLLDTALTQSFPKIRSEMDESSLSYSYNLEIQAEHMIPGLAASIIYDPDDLQHGIGGIEIIEFDIRAVPEYHQVLVPVYSTETPDSTAVRWANAQTAESEDMRLSKHVLPVSEHRVSAREVFVTDLNWNHPDWKIARDAWRSLLLELAILRYADGERDAFYYGVMDLNNSHGLLGLAYRGLPSGIGQADPLVLAHEVGHNMILKHAPCPSRPGVSGIDEEYPYRSGSIGTWGWNPDTGRLLDPEVWSDLMGACPNDWISWYNLELSMMYRIEYDYVAGASEPVLYVWGSIDEEGEIFLEPALLLEGPVSRSVAGSYRVEGFGVNGERVFTHGFIPDVIADTDMESFSIAIPYDPNWDAAISSLTVWGPGGAKTITEGSQPPMAVVLNASTGRIEAIRRNWNGKIPVGTEVLYSTGIPASRKCWLYPCSGGRGDGGV